jgi:hypothetical protein
MAKSRFSNTINIPFGSIKTDPKKFQGRQSAFSTDTTNAIVRKGFYDRSGEPLVVFKRGNDYIVISGHSRWEAIKQLYKSGKQPDLITVPVKVFQGSEDDAIDYAVIESNRGSTAEGLKSDLAAYKRARARGQNKEQLLAVFKPESRLEKLRRLTYLNTEGKFLEYLDSPEERSFPYLERNAIWVGELRRNLPQLTNAHENELFNYLYKTNTGKLAIKKDAFFNLVDKRVNRIDFDASGPLNLENKVSSSAYTDPIVEQIREIDKQKTELKKQIDSKTSNIARAKDMGKTELIPNLQKDISNLQQVMIRLEIERLRLEQTKGRLERETTVDLFADSVEPAPKAKKTTSKRRKLATPATARKKTKTMDIKKFAVGSVYEKRFIGDSDLKVKYKCTQRTASTATFQSVTRSSEVMTRKIKISGDSEYIVDGSYSMAPAIYASSLVKPTSRRRKIAAPAKARTAKKAVKPAPKPAATAKPKLTVKRKKTTPLQRLKRAARAIERPTGVKLDGTLKKGYTRLKNGDVVKATILKNCAPKRQIKKRK